LVATISLKNQNTTLFVRLSALLDSVASKHFKSVISPNRTDIGRDMLIFGLNPVGLYCCSLRNTVEQIFYQVLPVHTYYKLSEGTVFASAQERNATS
jgi:hypothetical protein